MMYNQHSGQILLLSMIFTGAIIVLCFNFQALEADTGLLPKMGGRQLGCTERITISPVHSESLRQQRLRL